MKLKNIALVGGGVAVLGYMYYKAAQTLSIKLNNVFYNNIDSSNLTLTIRLAVTNNSAVTLLTPVFSIDLYSDISYLGTAVNPMIQSIPPGVSYIDMTANIPIVSGATLVASMINHYYSTGEVALPQNLNYSGNINLWFTSIPINGNLT
jgi:hypothetical protein